MTIVSSAIPTSNQQTAAAAATGTFKDLLRVVRDYMGPQWPTLALAVVCMLITSAMTMGLAYVVQPAIKGLFLVKNSQALYIVPLEALGILWIRAASFYGQQALLGSIGERLVAAMQGDMFRKLIRRDLSSLNEVHSGQFVANFLYDATLMRDAINKGIAAIGLELVQLAGLAALMIYQAWKLAFLSVIVLPLVAWAMERIGASMRRATKRAMEETGNLSIALAEALDGRRIIKAYGREQHSSEHMDARIQTRLKHLLKIVRTSAAPIPTTDIFVGIVVALTLSFAGYLSFHGELEVDRFASFLAALLLAQQPIRNLSQLWTLTASGMTAAHRVFAVMDELPKIVDAASAEVLRVEPAPRGGAIRFQDVSFAYHANTAAQALNRVTFEAAPGQKIALVGPSGAGKTTILGLLLRFYDVNSGKIEIDGHDIRGVTIESLRNNIALVTQEPILFDESIAENIAVGLPGASRADIEKAARAAAAHDFIQALSQGYDTRVGEGGLKLSGGQRQRIAIARAMLRNAPILLLDEATSSLDTESERQVQDALAVLMKDRTTIVIAHRLSTVQDADRIHVLQHGAVVESGSHGELMLRGGLYARLYQHNFDDRDDETAIAATA